MKQLSYKAITFVIGMILGFLVFTAKAQVRSYEFNTITYQNFKTDSISLDKSEVQIVFNDNFNTLSIYQTKENFYFATEFLLSNKRDTIIDNSKLICYSGFDRASHRAIKVLYEKNKKILPALYLVEGDKVWTTLTFDSSCNH